MPVGVWCLVPAGHQFTRCIIALTGLTDLKCSPAHPPSGAHHGLVQIARAVHGLDPFKAKFETKLSAAGLALGEERDSLFKRHVVSVKLKVSLWRRATPCTMPTLPPPSAHMNRML